MKVALYVERGVLKPEHGAAIVEQDETAAEIWSITIDTIDEPAINDRCRSARSGIGIWYTGRSC